MSVSFDAEWRRSYLCGLWLTYRLESDDGVWRVTGTEGPVTIS